MNPCSKCGAPSARNHRYCLKCKAAHMREWRKRNPLTGEARKRASARWQAKEYRKRGEIVESPCVMCGAHAAEMHHPDYNKPKYVVWLCRSCHIGLHRYFDHTENVPRGTSATA